MCASVMSQIPIIYGLHTSWRGTLYHTTASTELSPLQDSHLVEISPAALSLCLSLSPTVQTPTTLSHVRTPFAPYPSPLRHCRESVVGVHELAKSDKLAGAAQLPTRNRHAVGAAGNDVSR